MTSKRPHTSIQSVPESRNIEFHLQESIGDHTGLTRQCEAKHSVVEGPVQLSSTSKTIIAEVEKTEADVVQFIKPELNPEEQEFLLDFQLEEVPDCLNVDVDFNDISLGTSGAESPSKSINSVFTHTATVVSTHSPVSKVTLSPTRRSSRSIKVPSRLEDMEDTSYKKRKR